MNNLPFIIAGASVDARFLMVGETFSCPMSDEFAKVWVGQCLTFVSSVRGVYNGVEVLFIEARDVEGYSRYLPAIPCGEFVTLAPEIF